MTVMHELKAMYILLYVLLTSAVMKGETVNQSRAEMIIDLSVPS